MSLLCIMDKFVCQSMYIRLCILIYIREFTVSEVEFNELTLYHGQIRTPKYVYSTVYPDLMLK